MADWSTYGVLGLVSGPALIALGGSMARCAPLSWGRVSRSDLPAMLASGALLSITLVQVAERRPESAGAVVWLVIVGLLLALIDWIGHRLPHRIVGVLLSGGLVQFGLSGLVQRNAEPLLRASVAAVAVFAIGLVIYMRSSGLGGGDVTLSTTMAFFLGWFSWRHVVLGLILALVLAALACLALSALRGVQRRQPIALGPALVFGSVCVILQA
ncbi:prepilin peptidase [Lentzea sp. NPDC102401]|uniref:prepilin peptidase n=1 Tax=Lentzea sp. NPDC102401 TaxID=3364128 RepID=UPI0037F63007